MLKNLTLPKLPPRLTFPKQKSTLFLTVGAATTLILGGGLAWWVLQRRVPVEGLPVGAGVFPQDTVATFSFTTDEGQWQQLRQFGTPTTQRSLDKTLGDLRDRLISQNGFDYNKDLKPWMGGEVSIGFLNPFPQPQQDANNNVITPYNPLAEIDIPPAVMVVPIANPQRAQELLVNPKVASGQKTVDREYKGVKIREVQGAVQRAYAAAVLDHKLLVLSSETKAIERVIDTFKEGESIAEIPGYREAFKSLETEDPFPFLRMYVNVPSARDLTAVNTAQPFPPLSLLFFPHNQGIAVTGGLRSEGVQFKGIAWLPPNSKINYKVENRAERMPSLLPTETVIAASGGNFQELWQNFSQKDDSNRAADKSKILNPDTFRANFAGWSGLNIDKDIAPWLAGEFAIGVVSAPAEADAKADITKPDRAKAEKTSMAKAGIVLLMQASDRQAADQAFKRLDGAMKSRNFKVTAADANSTNPIVTWESPFSSLKATRGWLDGNVAYLAIGAGVETLLPPPPGKTLAENSLFRRVDSAGLPQNNGHFFIEVDRLVNTDTTIPVPLLPTENKEFMQSIRAIGISSAIQDARSFRFDTEVLLRKINPLDGLPLPNSQPKSPEPSKSPEAAPSVAPSP